MKSLILDLHQKLVNKTKTVQDLIHESKKLNDSIKETNSIISDLYEQALKTNYQVNDSLLSGIPYSLKDNITTKDILTTGCSYFLSHYYPPFNATVYEILKQKQAVLVSKNNADEFGMGSTGTFSAYGIVKNYHNKEHVAGGSSSGAVNLVAAEVVPYAIGTDTGDSVRRPASLLGVVGYKPSYGLISRYGVIPYAPSLDHVGIITKYVADAAIVASEIFAFDAKDYTSQKLADSHLLFKNLKTVDKIKFVKIKNLEKLLGPKSKSVYLEAIDLIKQNNHEVIDVEVDDQLFEKIRACYLIIANVEAVSSHANLTGIPFGDNEIKGTYEETILNNRTHNLFFQAKRRFIVGSYVSYEKNFENLYIKAKKVRTYIINETMKILNQGDCLLLPGSATIAPKIEDVLNHKTINSFVDEALIMANFAGLPSITVPFSHINQLPVGINITCKAKEDQKTLNIALTLEGIFEKKYA